LQKKENKNQVKFLKEREKTFFKKLSRLSKVFENPKNFFQKVFGWDPKGKALRDKWSF